MSFDIQKVELDFIFPHFFLQKSVSSLTKKRDPVYVFQQLNACRPSRRKAEVVHEALHLRLVGKAKVPEIQLSSNALEALEELLSVKPNSRITLQMTQSRPHESADPPRRQKANMSASLSEKNGFEPGGTQTGASGYPGGQLGTGRDDVYFLLAHLPVRVTVLSEVDSRGHPVTRGGERTRFLYRRV
jgi:hypothetical protein